MPRSRLAPLVFLVPLALLAAPPRGALAQDKVLAFVGARLVPITGEEIPSGVLLVHEGKIAGLGAAGSVTIPPDAVIHNVADQVILPGLVCTHTHIGRVSGGDRSAALHPDVRALDAIDVRHPSVRRARAGGITTVNVMPGSGLLLSGQTVYLKLRDGGTIEDLMVRDEQGRPLGGLKMANGTNPRGDPPLPATRAKAAALARAHYVKAQHYRDQIARAGDDASKRPERDLGLEALVEVLEGRRVVHHHTHRHDDILTVLRLKSEFGFRVVLHHVSEGWKVADEIAAAGAPCSVIVIDSPGGKLEARDLDWRTGAILEQAGVKVAFHTDDPITDSRLFLRSAGLAVRAGMSREKALEAMTLAGAQMLDLDARVGSLESGKDADFVLLSGDPLSNYTKVLQTWIEGRKVFDRSDPEDVKFALGGPEAGDPDDFPLSCCIADDLPGGDG